MKSQMTLARSVLLLLLAGGSVGLCAAQADSLSLMQMRARLIRLDVALDTCNQNASALMRLLTFTEQLPHQYGPEQIRTFQTQLADLDTCLETATGQAQGLTETLPPRPETLSEAARRKAARADTLARLQRDFEALQRTLTALHVSKQQIGLQLDRLAVRLAPPDSTRNDHRR